MSHYTTDQKGRIYYVGENGRLPLYPDQVKRDLLLRGQLSSALVQMEFIQSCRASNPAVNDGMREVTAKLRELVALQMNAVDI